MKWKEKKKTDRLKVRSLWKASWSFCASNRSHESSFGQYKISEHDKYQMTLKGMKKN